MSKRILYSLGNITANSIATGTSNTFSGSFSASNNVSSPSQVTGLLFQTGTVKSFRALVTVTVSTSGGNLNEYVDIEGNYTDAGWSIFTSSLGDVSGVTFSIGSTGQVNYTSTNVVNWSSTTIRFSATVVTYSGSYAFTNMTTGTLQFDSIQLNNTTDALYNSSNGSFYSLGGGVFEKRIVIKSTIASTSTSTGSLAVLGGVGVGGNMIVGGNVGIGTAAPAYTLDINGTFETNNTNGSIVFASSGNVGINTTSPIFSSLDLGYGYNSAYSTTTGNLRPSLSFSWGGAGGGFRHFMTSRHNGATGSNSNAIDFWLNNSATSTAATGPNASTTLGMSVTASGVNIPKQGSSAGNLYNSFDTLSLTSPLGSYSGGIASIFFGNSQGNYPLARIYGIDVAGGGGFQGNLAFQVGNGTNLVESMRILSNGNVGIGTTNPTYTLDVNGNCRVNSGIKITGTLSESIVLASAAYLNSPNSSTFNTGWSNGGGSNYWSLYCSSRLAASELWCFSDERIKKNISSMDQDHALQLVRQLRPVEYSFIDIYEKDNANHYGYIAQEVGKVLSQCVTTATDFIPNVYAMCKVTNGNCLIAENPFPFTAPCSIQIILKTGQKETLQVTSVNNCQLVYEKHTCNMGDDIFVYGSEVNDCQTVNYQETFVLGMSALQALDKKVQRLEEKFSSLLMWAQSQGYT